MLDSYHQLSLHEYLVGLMGNAGCKELVFIRDDPRSTARNYSAVHPVTGSLVRSRSLQERGKQRKGEDQATLTVRSRTKTENAISNFYKIKDSIMIVDCDGESDHGAICNEHDGTCRCECTMCKEWTMREVSWDSTVHDCAHSLLSRKTLVAPSPPPPTSWASGPCSSVAASPSSVLFHPNTADRRPLRRLGRATTIPSTRFDLRRDLGYDYHHCSRSELKTDGPPCPPQRRPSIRNLDSQE